MKDRALLLVALVVLPICAVPATAAAEQWKVTLARIEVAPTKPTGQPWDGDGSPPDVVGEFAIGRLNGDRCQPRLKEPIPKHQDAFNFAAEISIVTDVEPGVPACFAFRIVDRDLAADDAIASGAAALEVGEKTHDFGAARLQINVAAAGRPARHQTALRPVTFPPAPAARTALYRVSVVTARISPAKPDGTTWDPATDKDAEDARMLQGLLEIGLAYATGGTSAIVKAGTSTLKAGESGVMTHKAQTVAAPDPQIIIRWGGLVFSTPKNKNTLAPRWDYQFVVPAEIAERKPLRVDVLDVDDGEDESIGADSVPGREAVGSDVFRRKFGAIEELVLEVERVSEGTSPHEQVIKVDTTRGWTDTGIEVIAGQQVQVAASGEHCFRGGRCFGPDGDTSVVLQLEDRVDGTVAPVRTGQLSAVIGDDIIAIGSAASFTARSSGRLLLGAASRTSSGALTANVRLFYPLHAAH